MNIFSINWGAGLKWNLNSRPLHFKCTTLSPDIYLVHLGKASGFWLKLFSRAKRVQNQDYYPKCFQNIKIFYSKLINQLNWLGNTHFTHLPTFSHKKSVISSLKILFFLEIFRHTSIIFFDKEKIKYEKRKNYHKNWAL